MKKELITLILGFIISLFVFGLIYILGEAQLNVPFELIPPEYISEFLVILPGPLYSDIIFLYLLPIAFFFLFWIISPYLVVFYYKLHKGLYTFRIKPQYGMAELGKHRRSSVLMFRSLILSFFAFNISAYLVQLGLAPLFRANLSAIIDSELEILHMAEAVFLGTFFLTSFSLIVFLPFWLIEDSGLISYRILPEEIKPPVVKSVSAVYLNLLSDLVGFSTILILILYIIQTLEVLQPGDPAILTPIILIILPFIITGLFAIPFYLYERYLPKILDKLYLRLERHDIPHIKIPSFHEIQNKWENK